MFQTIDLNDHQVRVSFRITQRYCKAKAPSVTLLALGRS